MGPGLEFLDEKGARALVEFWLSAESFRSDLQQRAAYSPEEAQEDAMVLYDRCHPFPLQLHCRGKRMAGTGTSPCKRPEAGWAWARVCVGSWSSGSAERAAPFPTASTPPSGPSTFTFTRSAAKAPLTQLQHLSLAALQKYLEPFLRSSSFESYLKELIYTIQNTLVLPDPDRLRQGSREPS